MRSQRGFSLIELMITLAIVVILLVASAPSFSAFVQNRKVRNEAESIHSGLTLAKMEAVRRNTTTTFTLATNSSWAVTCATCTDTLPSISAAEVPSNVTTTATAATITFNGFGRASYVSVTPNATINVGNVQGACMTSSGTGTIRCLRVIVTPGGQVRTCDPVLTDTDSSSPQACPS